MRANNANNDERPPSTENTYALAFRSIPTEIRATKPVLTAANHIKYQILNNQI